MCRLNKDDLFLFYTGIFDIYNTAKHYIELISKSGQHWCIYKEDENIIILLHKHNLKDKYHVHYIFTDTSKALSEILAHERYIEKRKKEHKKICGNRKFKIIL